MKEGIKRSWESISMEWRGEGVRCWVRVGGWGWIWWFWRGGMAGGRVQMRWVGARGAVAQVVAQFHGVEGIGGWYPASSTKMAGARCTGRRYLACTLVVQHSGVQQGV